MAGKVCWEMAQDLLSAWLAAGWLWRGQWKLLGALVGSTGGPVLFPRLAPFHPYRTPALNTAGHGVMPA